MKAPESYAEWADVLDALASRRNDAEVLSAMQAGTIPWQSGVAERFARRLIDTVNGRMNAATDQFQKSMSRSRGQESLIVQAVLSLRKELQFLARVMDIPVIPEKDRRQYVQMVRNQADQMQKSLEDSARTDRTGKLGSIVRNHRVNAF